MKALRLSSIALLFFSIFSSCTKDTCSLDDPSLLSSRSGSPGGVGNNWHPSKADANFFHFAIHL